MPRILGFPMKNLVTIGAISGLGRVAGVVSRAREDGDDAPENWDLAFRLSRPRPSSPIETRPPVHVPATWLSPVGCATPAFHPVSGTRTAAGCPVAGIREPAPVQRQAAAADAFGQTGSQALELGDACLNARRPAL